MIFYYTNTNYDFFLCQVPGWFYEVYLSYAIT